MCDNARQRTDDSGGALHKTAVPVSTGRADSGDPDRARTEPIHRWVRDVASTCPTHLAVRDDVHTLTYAELDARANALAHRLRALGVKPGARVGLCHERSAVTVIGALATLKAGGAYVGIDPAYPDARLDYMLRDAEVAVLLTQSSMTARLASTCLLYTSPSPRD